MCTKKEGAGVKGALVNFVYRVRGRKEAWRNSKTNKQIWARYK